jgi:signal transduction histidine kinase
LITVQEEERSRLARELHDGICQSLALLAIKLDRLGRSHSPSGTLLAPDVRELSDQMKRLAGDVRRLSHDLTPLTLEQLGLESAIRGLCEDLSKACRFGIDCHLRHIPGDAPRAVSLSAFRVVQEALQNVIKHSDATRANVSIECDGGELRIGVTDNGRGFDTRAPMVSASTGLANMRERVRAVGGSFAVESSPGLGTRIDARIPCPADCPGNAPS